MPLAISPFSCELQFHSLSGSWDLRPTLGPAPTLISTSPLTAQRNFDPSDHILALALPTFRDTALGAAPIHQRRGRRRRRGEEPVQRPQDSAKHQRDVSRPKPVGEREARPRSLLDQPAWCCELPEGRGQPHPERGIRRWKRSEA